MDVFLFCGGENISSEKWQKESVFSHFGSLPLPGELIEYKKNGGKKEKYEVISREFKVKETWGPGHYEFDEICIIHLKQAT